MPSGGSGWPAAQRGSSLFSPHFSPPVGAHCTGAHGGDGRDSSKKSIRLVVSGPGKGPWEAASAGDPQRSRDLSFCV